MTTKQVCANCGKPYDEHLLWDGNKCSIGSINGWFPKTIADTLSKLHQRPKEEQRHSKPWKVVSSVRTKNKAYIEDAEGNVILDGPYLDAATEAVTAVNSFEAQRECILQLASFLTDVHDGICNSPNCEIAVALAKAKELLK